MSTVGKLQAKLAELLQINEAMVTHIESLVSERDYFKNGMAELQDIIDKLEPERDALAAQVEVLHSFIESVMANIGAGATLDEVCDMLCDYWDSPKQTPSQCLREIRAEAVEKAANFLRFAPVDGGQKWAVRYVDLLEYADKVRNGE